jgi:uncharacterized protein YdeI (YjbR/CyaY-like superfamily)
MPEVDLPIVLCETPEQWRAWLSENHATCNGVWVQIAKKDSGQQSVTYLQALDEALCFGWIDGVPRKLDDQYYLQRFTPRRKRSVWSQVNREKVDALIAQGRMMPAGQREVDAAKADGRWDAAYAPPSRVEVPADLQSALEAHPAAAAQFAALNRTNRFGILARLQSVKREATRQARISEIIAQLAAGNSDFKWTKKKE